MQYCSTRGGVHGWDFRDVLFSGYAPDGGMFMPESVPVLSLNTLRDWSGLSYTQLVVEVASLFIPTQLIPRQDVEALVTTALSGFSVPEVVRIARLKDSLSVLELFHGDTLAFKDLAMTCTVRFLDYFLQKENRRATVLVGTSGDTGGSAIQSAKGLSGLDVVVVYPRGRITPVQEKHMITCLEDNVHVFAADGCSDDIDQPLRGLFGDQELVTSHGLMSLNSVNWSRIMVQLAHFIYAYLQLSDVERAEDDGALPELEVVVPTGGAGNIAAGFIVKQMGVPLRLVAMVNSNDIVHRTVTSGDFSMATNVMQTLAPAIDIQDPYNMERVFWLLLGKDGASVKKMMENFQHSHRHSLPENHRRLLSQVLSSGTVSDEGILETMRRCWEENQYVLCPHTAVAVWHHYHCPHSPGINRCYIATASPAKFQSAIQKAGLTFDLPEKVQELDKLATRYENLERSPNWCKDWEGRLREKIQYVSAARKNRVSYYR
ncbi:threonine synthase-like 2 [Sphaeramia orbicularis]|uniref:Threonine synthase-like 2 n=1 Tax=Sphaeramia orbicularis TaxID=375764 RepID=A0A673BAG7_9TELE|nr:threonine synthase-like 2 [Sphaeramia orbicularis]XP_030006832.1 threonine synthase-like 2 [Sphaeramia orbicularis]XP_030006833.1 threonine synthase-like 2 [Sphaeramia orbicularis]XP_030006834.1 threonine synthase-like 2 [Sphaeramia orbicularis]